MPRYPLRNFPAEASKDSWPLLQPEPEDLQYIPRAKPKALQQKQLNNTSQMSSSNGGSPLIGFISDLFSAFFRGMILGVYIFALVYSFLPLHTFWLSGWHFVYPIIGVIVLRILFGANVAIISIGIVALVVSLWFNWRLVVTHPIIPLLFVACGALFMCVWEFFPRRT